MQYNLHFPFWYPKFWSRQSLPQTFWLLGTICYTAAIWDLSVTYLAVITTKNAYFWNIKMSGFKLASAFDSSYIGLHHWNFQILSLWCYYSNLKKKKKKKKSRTDTTASNNAMNNIMMYFKCYLFIFWKNCYSLCTQHEIFILLELISSLTFRMRIILFTSCATTTRINFRITPPPRSNLYFTYYHPQSSY